MSTEPSLPTDDAKARFELELKRHEFLLKLEESWLEKTYRVALIVGLANGAALGACFAAIKDHPQLRGADLIATAATWFGNGTMAAGAALFFYWIGSELVANGLEARTWKNFALPASPAKMGDRSRVYGLARWIFGLGPLAISALYFASGVAYLTGAMAAFTGSPHP